MSNRIGRLASSGIGSLMAVELSIGLEASLGRPLPATLLQAERTLAELTDRIDCMFSAAEEKSSLSAVSEAEPDGRAGAFTPALRTLGLGPGPGTILLDDSYPPTFTPDAAWRRMDEE
jgi:hypothetical protein